MKKLYVLLLAIAAQFAHAQTADWTWVSGIQASVSNPNHILSVDGQGNLYTFSTFTNDVITDDYQFINTSNNNDDSFFVKYNADGEWQWARQITGTGQNVLWNMQADTDGNTYLLGSYTNGVGIGGQTFTGSGTFIAKFDTDGNMLWIKTGSFSFPDGLEVDDNGNIYFQVTSINAFNFNSTAFTHVNLVGDNQYLAKLDTNGNIIWKKTYYGPDLNAPYNSLEQLKVDHQGNLLLTGTTNQSSITFDDLVLTNAYTGAFFLVKFNADGVPQWATSTGNNNCSNGAADVVVDANDNIYLLGNYCSTVNFGSTQLTVSPSGSRYFISKYSPEGENIWVKTSIQGPYSKIMSGDFDAQGNLIVGGALIGTATFGQNVTLTSSSTSSGAQFVVMYNTDGNAVWGTTTGPIDVNNAIDVKAFGENTIYTGAHMQLAEVNYGSINYVRQGTNLYNRTLGKLVYTTLDAPAFNKPALQVYPNPVSDILNVSTNTQVLHTQVTDCNGRIVAVAHGQKEISLTNLQPGIYFATIETASGKETKKIIKN